MDTFKTCLTALLSRGSTERAKLDHSSNDFHPRSVILVPSPSQAGFVRQDGRSDLVMAARVTGRAGT